MSSQIVGENPPREQAVRIILGKSSSLIHSMLVSDYGVPADEAARLTAEICEWFDRLARRPGSPASISGLRYQLISMTCKIGHVYWSGRVSGPPTNETVRRTLALGPEIIAFELDKRFEEAGDP